jgi:hypothetical protein
MTRAAPATAPPPLPPHGTRATARARAAAVPRRPCPALFTAAGRAQNRRPHAPPPRGE